MKSQWESLLDNKITDLEFIFTAESLKAFIRDHSKDGWAATRQLPAYSSVYKTSLPSEHSEILKSTSDELKKTQSYPQRLYFDLLGLPDELISHVASMVPLVPPPPSLVISKNLTFSPNRGLTALSLTSKRIRSCTRKSLFSALRWKCGGGVIWDENTFWKEYPFRLADSLVMRLTNVKGYPSGVAFERFETDLMRLSQPKTITKEESISVELIKHVEIGMAVKIPSHHLLPGFKKSSRLMTRFRNLISVDLKFSGGSFDYSNPCQIEILQNLPIWIESLSFGSDRLTRKCFLILVERFEGLKRLEIPGSGRVRGDSRFPYTDFRSEAEETRNGDDENKDYHFCKLERLEISGERKGIGLDLIWDVLEASKETLRSFTIKEGVLPSGEYWGGEFAFDDDDGDGTPNPRFDSAIELKALEQVSLIGVCLPRYARKRLAIGLGRGPVTSLVYRLVTSTPPASETLTSLANIYKLGMALGQENDPWNPQMVTALQFLSTIHEERGDLGMGGWYDLQTVFHNFELAKGEREWNILRKDSIKIVEEFFV